MTPDKRVEDWYDNFIDREHRKPDKEDIIAFLNGSLTQDRQDLMSEVVENAHRMRTKVECQEDIGWNNALDDIIKSLSK